MNTRRFASRAKPVVAAPASHRPSARRAACLWTLFALVLYVATCTPGVGWQDSGIHQYRILTGQLEHDRGLALSHPVHFWVGRALLHLPPAFGEPAWRLNVLSAVFGAIGVGLVAAIVTDLTRSRLAAAVAALATACSHSYWQMSVVTEVYTMAAGLMTVEWCLLLACLRRRRPALLLALFAVNGLHFGVHQFALFTLATYGVFALVQVWRGRLRAGWLLAAVLLWFAVNLPNWLMVAAYFHRTHDALATVRSFLFGSGWSDEVLNVRLDGRQLALAGLTLAYCFPSLVVPAAVVGLLRPARRRGRTFRRVLVAQTILIGGFVMRYPVVDLYTFFVPLCALGGVWFGLGADRLLRAAPSRRLRRGLLALLVANALLPPVVYLAFPAWARPRHLLAGRLRDLPFRDEYTYFFRPWRCGDDSAARFARDALARTGAGGWLLADSTSAPAAAYTYLVHGGPPNVRIYSEWTCLNVPAAPPLEAEDVLNFARGGGCVVVVAGSKTERIWVPRLPLDRSDPYYWYVRIE